MDGQPGKRNTDQEGVTRTEEGKKKEKKKQEREREKKSTGAATTTEARVNRGRKRKERERRVVEGRSRRVKKLVGDGWPDAVSAEGAVKRGDHVRRGFRSGTRISSTVA